MEYVDLHCHSTASDGTLAPAEVVRLAKRGGLWGMALTDHDTVGGLAEAREEAERLGVRFLNGIEISSSYQSPGTLHLLGYGVDGMDGGLAGTMKGLREARDDRNPRIVKRLGELGVAISMEDVEAAAGGGVVGRPHVAAVLVRKGYVSSIKEAFNKYLGAGGSAYFDKERLASRRAIEVVRGAGGVACLAHPVQLRTENDAQLARVVKDLADEGLEAIEVIHSDQDWVWVEKLTDLAKKMGLLVTGGSDFHGLNKTDIQLGVANGRRIPAVYMEKLLERCAERAKNRGGA